MKKNSVNKILVIGAILIVLEIILGFLFLGIFSASNSRMGSKLSTETANEGAANLAGELTRDFDSVKDILAAAAAVSGGDKAILSSDKFLNDVGENLDSAFVAYVDENGMIRSGDGKTLDISETNYADKLYAGKVIHTVDCGFKEKPYPGFIVSVPVDEDRTAYLAAYISPTFIEENFKENPSYSSSFFVLVDEDHRSVYIAGKPGNLFLAEGVLWENLRKFAKSQEEWNAFSNAYDSGEQYIMEAYQAKIVRKIAYAPVENTDWKLIIGYDQKYLAKIVSGYTNHGKVFVVEIPFIFIAVLLTFSIIALRVRSRSDTSSKELTGKAETDLLTGVLNKLATESKIKEYIASNPSAHGVLILIDVDNFKKINDKMGHAFGDEVLRNLGLRLKTLYRATDIVGRIGGDEFIVFLKDISDMSIIEREARKLEVFFRDFEVGEYTKYSVNASLGATIFPMDGQNFETLYKNADSALYYVKQNGKNKLVFYKEDEKFPEEDRK